MGAYEGGILAGVMHVSQDSLCHVKGSRIRAIIKKHWEAEEAGHSLGLTDDSDATMKGRNKRPT